MGSLAALAVAGPLLAAALLMAAGRVLPRRVVEAAALLVAGAVAIALAVLLVRTSRGTVVYWFGGWTPRRGIALGVTFAVDPLGAGLAALAALLMVAALVFSWRYFEAVGSLYHSLMMVLLAAMVGFALSGDLFNMFVFFELMGVAAYALTGYRIEERAPVQGALN